MSTEAGSRRWKGVAWSRTLPRPERNGRFYRLGHVVAVLLAGHAHQDGTGITVSARTVAEEAWCTLAEAEEALAWLRAEEWFIESQGPKGIELACNLEMVRATGSVVEDRDAHRRARLAKNSREYRRRKAEEKQAATDDSPMTHPDDASNTVIDPRHQRHRGPSSTSSGCVIESDDGTDDMRRSEPHKTLKTHEDPEDPKPRSTADASDAPVALFAVIGEKETTAEKKVKQPANVLADVYHDALEGNINYVAVLKIIRSALGKYPYAEVERGVRALADMPEKPLTKQTLYVSMRGQGSSAMAASRAPLPERGAYPDDPFSEAA